MSSRRFICGFDTFAMSYGALHCLTMNWSLGQVVQDGYKFFAGQRLVTVFSAPNYCGELNNAGAMMNVDGNLQCSFQILQPTEKMGLWNKLSRSGTASGKVLNINLFAI